MGFDSIINVVFKASLVVLLSAFMLATAVSFLRFRIKRKEAEYRRIIRVLGIGGNEAQSSIRLISEEYAPSDYFLPVTFATLVCIFGFTALMFGEELVRIRPDKANILLTGPYTEKNNPGIENLRWQSMVVLTMAFIGAFLWSAQNIIRRLIAGDLAPSTYYSSALRIIFAAALSLILSFLLEGTPAKEYTKELLPVIAFLTGMLPEQALLYLRERIGIFSERSSGKADDLPLRMIEGINMFSKIRLAEVGIDNAQNLAEADIVELLLKTPFNPCQLIDWIAQAKLYVYFKEDINRLRAMGIRTVFDLKSACGDQDQIAHIADGSGVSSLSLGIVCERISTNQGVTELQEFERKLRTDGHD